VRYFGGKLTEFSNSINVVVTEVLSANEIILSLTETGNKRGKAGLKQKET